MKRLLLALGLLMVLVMWVHADNPHGPSVVASVSYINQASSISTTTLYTPSSDGDFLVMIYGNAQTSSNLSNSSIDFHLLWTDDQRTEDVRTAIGPGGTGTLYSNPSIVVHATSGNPIQISGIYSPGTSNLSYNIFVTVIKE